MARLVKGVFIFMMLAAVLCCCSTSRKSYNEKKGLMLLENTQLERNKAYNSRHNVKAKKNASNRINTLRFI